MENWGSENIQKKGTEQQCLQCAEFLSRFSSDRVIPDFILTGCGGDFDMNHLISFGRQPLSQVISEKTILDD
jgi:hypothetical protein